MMQVEGTQISNWFLRVETQPEVGEEGYDAGAKILTDFFHKLISPYLDESDLHPIGRRAIEACLDGATVDDYQELLG
jgi:hypothetical protein